jgi:hypothetical protein
MPLPACAHTASPTSPNPASSTAPSSSSCSNNSSISTHRSSNRPYRPVRSSSPRDSLIAAGQEDNALPALGSRPGSGPRPGERLVFPGSPLTEPLSKRSRLRLLIGEVAAALPEKVLVAPRVLYLVPSRPSRRRPAGSTSARPTQRHAAHQAQQEASSSKLAQCMRAHGVPDLHDPSSDGGFAIPKSVDENSSTFQATEIVRDRRYGGDHQALQLRRGR